MTITHATQILESVNFADVLRNLGDLGNTLVITSSGFKQRGQLAAILNALRTKNTFSHDQVTPNPQVNSIDLLLKEHVGNQINSIVALGGGSVLDTAKALRLALMMKEPTIQKLLDFAGDEFPLERQIKLITIPTTSGTGAEVTPFATLWDDENDSKHSVVGPSPEIAILDPNLTLSLNRQDTLFPALDALSHSLESLWNINSTQRSRKLAVGAIDKIVRSLPLVLKQPESLEARKQLQLAATNAGLAISHTKTAIAHAISYPFTLKHGVPHGLACSFTLACIIKEFGAHKLKLEGVEVDTLLEVLESLSLAKELAVYVDSAGVHELSKLKLAPSRAGNFLLEASPEQVERVIVESAAL